MSRRKIKRVTQNPKSYGDEKPQFPTVTIRPNSVNKIHNVKQNIQKRTFKTNTGPLLDPVKSPINFLRSEFANINKDICFVVGGVVLLRVMMMTTGKDTNFVSSIETNDKENNIPNSSSFETSD